MPRNAPAVFLAFLGTGFVLSGAGIFALHALAAGGKQRAKKVLVGAVCLVGVYFGVLLAFSLGSEEKALAQGEQKYFCEVDCHEAYSVVKVVRTRTLGTPLGQQSARGNYYIVTVKVWFDERTISSRRGNAPLRPNPRTVAVVDEMGRRYRPSPEGQNALERLQGQTRSLTRSLRPGESYTTDLVFDLPSAIRNPRL